MNIPFELKKSNHLKILHNKVIERPKKVFDFNIMFNEEECNRLLCPPIDHPFHDPCHYHNDKRARLMFLLGQNKENITPDSIKDFEIRDLTISLLYHDCQQEHEFQFFLFKASEFNDSLLKFLTNKGFVDPPVLFPLGDYQSSL